MKTSFWDRMLMFLYVLITLAFGLCMALRPFGVDLFGGLFSALEGAAGSFIAALIGLGLAAIVALLSAYMLMMIFRKGKRHAAASFITVNSGDGGQVRIALSALAQMARRAVGRVEGVHEMKINVSGSDDAIEVAVELVMEAGAHVPSVTTNMQRAIRNRIESNCGVAVRDVQELESFCKKYHPVVAVLCIPRESAKELAPTLVSLGIKGFWNFSHYDLSVDFNGITVENAHLGDSLMSLGYRVRNPEISTGE